MVGRFGVLPRSNTASASLRCYCCAGAALASYHDTARGGFWHACPACGAAGDGLELVEAQTGHTTAAAVGLLARQDSAADVKDAAAVAEAYLRFYREPCERLRAAWPGFAAKFPRSPLVSKLYWHRRWVLSEELLQTWPSQGGKVFGIMTREDLETVLGPSAMAGFGAKRPEDEEHVIQPLYDLPGRISSLRVLRFKAPRARGSHVWERFDVGGLGVQPGVLLLDNVWTLPPGAPIVVALDLDAATSAFLHGAGRQEITPPLVGVDPQLPVPPILQELSLNRPVVVWSQQASPETIRFAASLSAYLAIQPEALSDALRREGCQGWLSNLRAVASPWHRFVAARLASASVEEASDLLSQSPLDSVTAQLISREAAAGERRRVDQVLAGVLASRSEPLRIGGTNIVVRDGAWLETNGDVVCDFRVRLDEVHHQPSTGKTWYRGVALRSEGSLPFVARSEIFEKDPLGFVSRLAVASGQPIPRVKSSWRGHKAFELVLSSHRPSTRILPAGSGWDRDSGSLILPGFVLKPGGGIETNEIPESCEGFAAKNLLPPGSYRNDRELAELPDIVWPILLHVLGSVLASPCQGKTPGLAVSGASILPVLDIAAAAGCLASRPAQGGWPSALELASRQDRRWCREPQNAIVLCDEVTAGVLAINGNWQVMTGVNAAPLRRDLWLCVGALVSDFLHFVAARGFGESLRGGDVRPRTLEFWRTFLQERGTLAAVPEATAAARIDPAEAFFDVLDLLVKRRGLRQEDYGKHTRKSGVVLHENGVWIGKGHVNACLEKLRTLPIDETSLLPALAAAGALSSLPRPSFADAGWFLDAKWWQARKTANQEQQRPKRYKAAEGDD